MRGDVDLGNILVILDACLAAELAPPVVDGVFHFGGRPLADLFVQLRAGRPDHQEAVHEGVVDRPLQAMRLRSLPSSAGAASFHLPSTLRKWAIQERSESGSDASISSPSILTFGFLWISNGQPGGNRQRQGRDVLGFDLWAVQFSLRCRLRLHAGLFPVLFQAVDLHPEGAVIPQRPGGEAEPSGALDHGRHRQLRRCAD